MKTRIAFVFGIVMAMCLCLAGCQSSETTKQEVIYKNAPGDNVPDDDLDWQDIYLDNIMSVVKVEIYQCTDYEMDVSSSCYYYSHGSGFVVDDNVVATNWHVAEYYTQVNLSNLPSSVTYYKLYVRYPADMTLHNNDFLIDKYEVTGVYSGLNQHDLALLKVNTLERQPVKFSKDRWEDAKILTEVMAMGYPRDFEFVATTGTITDILVNDDWFIYWASPDTKYYKTDAQIDGGNSGGPMFNKYGEVIGVNFSSWNTGTTTHFFALTADYLKQVNFNNAPFQGREIPDIKNFVATQLFAVNGEINPIGEYEHVTNFEMKENCLYKIDVYGDEWANDGSPQTPASVNIELWWTYWHDYRTPDPYNIYHTKWSIYQPPDPGTTGVYLTMDQVNQPNPGWYMAYGWEWCPAE